MLFLTRPAPVKPGAGRGAIGSHVLGVPTWEWLAALVVVLGSAGASASETALTALGDLKARQLF